MIGKFLMLVLLTMVFVSCGNGTSTTGHTMVVSIEPLRYIVEEIVGDDFEINVLVPPGASPETFEPTPLQIRVTEDASLVFSTGLIGFETIILDRLSAPERFVELSSGIELISTAESVGASPHVHGVVDPHIWMSPKALATMARTAYGRIHELWPDSISYTANYAQLEERLATLDSEVSQRIATAAARSFMIFHPGLTYYARDYGLRQIALEIDGKEPSARQLSDIIELARAEGISKVLYQSEFPRRTVEVVAAEIGAEPVEITVLGYDVLDNIMKITDLIAGSTSIQKSPVR